MAAGYQIRDQSGIYFITFAVVEWVDVFTRKDYANLLVESLQYPAVSGVFHLTPSILPQQLPQLYHAAGATSPSQNTRIFLISTFFRAWAKS